MPLKFVNLKHKGRNPAQVEAELIVSTEIIVRGCCFLSKVFNQYSMISVHYWPIVSLHRPINKNAYELILHEDYVNAHLRQPLLLRDYQGFNKATALLKKALLRLDQSYTFMSSVSEYLDVDVTLSKDLSTQLDDYNNMVQWLEQNDQSHLLNLLKNK